MSHLLVIEARYYAEIADQLVKGVDAEMKKANATYDVVTTTGAYELPATLGLAVKGKKKYDGFILLGCVIRGQTTHYDQILDAVFPKIVEMSVENDLALGMGVLTCENDEQAEYRADPEGKNYGGAAARAALRMIQPKKHFLAA
jgi:6,7-dimethyl-8-ribityllumazine synthase